MRRAPSKSHLGSLRGGVHMAGLPLVAGGAGREIPPVAEGSGRSPHSYIRGRVTARMWGPSRSRQASAGDRLRSRARVSAFSAAMCWMSTARVAAPARTAAAKAAIWAVASVPERRPSSWPPPRIRGGSFSPGGYTGLRYLLGRGSCARSRSADPRPVPPG